MIENKAPTLYEIKEATRDDGLVGEERNVLTFYLGTLNGNYLLFDGPAGSGKDQTIHSALYLIDSPEKIDDNESDVVHYWSNASSPKAPFYNARNLNKKPVHVIPDQVAVNPDFEMIIKAFGEGQPATHEKVDVTKDDSYGPEGQMESMTINCPRCVAMSIATDNEKIDMKDLSELDSRAFTLTPDSSEDQTRAINTRQVELRDGTYARRVDDARLEEIRQYYRSIPVKKYTESNAGKILNLTMAGIQEQEPLPPKFVKARRDLPRLMDFIDAVALYHHADRMEVKSEYPQKLLVAPADAWYGFKIFGEELVMSALNLKPLDRKLLNFMRSRPNKKYSAMDLQAEMQDPEYGENRAVSEIRKALDNMIHKMYVQRHEDNPVSFSASPFGQSIDVAQQAKLDWELVVDRAKTKARSNLENEEDAEQYISQYCEGDGLLCTHPVSGEVVNIVEDTEFEEALDEAQDAVDDEFGDGLWDGPVGDESTENVAADGGESSGTL